MDQFNEILGAINGILWHDAVLFIVLGVGVLFTLWSGFCQYRALTHGGAVVRGKYDKKSDPGAINHFQALSAALSATVGLGNIGGVALAISLGGPGAVFWMWIVGLFGMAIKTTEVTQSMLFRNTSDPDNPHGGPMYVAAEGFKKLNPKLAWLGKTVGVIFCITLLISAVTGGNMFQAWNVGILVEDSFQVPQILTGIILAVIVGAVIIGGIKRIGAVAGRLVPFMCAIYILAAGYVLILNFSELPGLLALIVKSAFAPTEAAGAFIGGTAATAFLFGMKRALFSNEAGQGSAPIAHSAAKSSEPVREGIVAGLEPFIDTIVVCTITALVILSSGIWNRGPESSYAETPQLTQTEAGWQIQEDSLPLKSSATREVTGEWYEGESIFMVGNLGDERSRFTGVVSTNEDGDLFASWNPIESSLKPELLEPGIYADYPGAALTAKAFDRVLPGLGYWLVPIAAFLFAVSTMISWSYYGEQGMIFMLGERSVLPYKFVYCILAVVATSGLIQTETELDNLTGLGTGVMLFANIPIMLIFGHYAMKAYHKYIGRLKAGEFKETGHPSLVDVVEGKDTED